MVEVKFVSSLSLGGKVRVADRENDMYIRPRVLSPLLPLTPPPKDSYYMHR